MKTRIGEGSVRGLANIHCNVLFDSCSYSLSVRTDRNTSRNTIFVEESSPHLSVCSTFLKKTTKNRLDKINCSSPFRAIDSARCRRTRGNALLIVRGPRHAEDVPLAVDRHLSCESTAKDPRETVRSRFIERQKTIAGVLSHGYRVLIIEHATGLPFPEGSFEDAELSLPRFRLELL